MSSRRFSAALPRQDLYYNTTLRKMQAFFSKYLKIILRVMSGENSKGVEGRVWGAVKLFRLNN